MCSPTHTQTHTHACHKLWMCDFASRHFCTLQKLLLTHCNCAPSKSSNSVYPFSLKNFFFTFTHTHSNTGEQCSRHCNGTFSIKSICQAIFAGPQALFTVITHRELPFFRGNITSIMLGNG